MALTAENLAVKFDIKRDAVDAFALQSQQRWSAANAAGVFKTEITPVALKVKGKDLSFEVDEHPKWVICASFLMRFLNIILIVFCRPKATIEDFQKLRAVFKKDGVVTAGSASVR